LKEDEEEEEWWRVVVEEEGEHRAKNKRNTAWKIRQQKYTQLFTGNTPKYTNWAYFRPFP
jgi:hypothetical protein